MGAYDNANNNGGRYLNILGLLNECKAEAKDPTERDQIDEALSIITVLAYTDFQRWKQDKKDKK